MRFGLVVLGAVLLATVATSSACAPEPYWKGPVGVSDKAEVASDRSIDMDGGDNYACAHSPELLEGKPCAPEGAVCGQVSSDPHQLSSTLACRDGAWDREDSPAPTAPASAKTDASSSAKP